VAARRKTWVGRIYLATNPDGTQLYFWVGRFPSKRERDDAVAKARIERPWETEAAPDELTCDEWAEWYLKRIDRDQKRSSARAARQRLKRFQNDFADRPLSSITRPEAIDWAERAPVSCVPVVVTLFNTAVEQERLVRSPFRGLGSRTRGRADVAPPTEHEFDRLLLACSALGDYGPTMHALVLFGAYTGMRPGELFALEWADRPAAPGEPRVSYIDLAAHRVHVRRRVYHNELDVPKSNRERVIALPPPAQDVLEALVPDEDARFWLVFRSVTGRRLSQPTLSGYWGKVKAAAGLDHDFYLATKHYGVHLLYKAGLSKRAIASQMGWTEESVDSLLRVYGHIDLIPLAEVDALYEAEVSDALSDAEAIDPAL